MSLIAEDAQALFDAHCPRSDDPPLTDAQVAEYMNEGLVPDSEGRTPADTGYVETYDKRGVYAAIVEGWLGKAGNAAGRFDFESDGQRFSRSQVAARCEAMATRYAKKIGVSTRC